MPGHCGNVVLFALETVGTRLIYVKNLGKGKLATFFLEDMPSRYALFGSLWNEGIYRSFFWESCRGRLVAILLVMFFKEGLSDLFKGCW